jgi:hypothetical protein
MRTSSRREALALLGGPLVAGLASAWNARADVGETLPPVRAITRGPKHHWFAYYDKLQFDPTNRLVLGNEVAFEHRSPTAADEIAVGYVDLSRDDQWTEIGTSHAWNWQQGCMLQWMPGDSPRVIWNDRGSNGDYVSHILDTSSGERRTLPSPIYALSPDGKSAIVTDFRRLNDVRPGYGYPGLPDPFRDEAAPERSGVWRVDLETGRRELIVSIATLFQFGDITDEMRRSKHWFNHLLYNTNGTRIVFLHRWATPEMGTKNRRTRMITANVDGSDLFVLDPSGYTSHFVWRDERHILAWSRHRDQPGFYVFRDKSDVVEPVGAGILAQDGHCTYVPQTRDAWILSDTYPDRERKQHPYLFHPATSRKVPLGHFLSPAPYTGEWRCDTHPRTSRDGRFAVIDSPHGGTGRQMHLIDLSGALASA